MPQIAVPYDLYFELSVALAHRIAQIEHEIRLGDADGYFAAQLAKSQATYKALVDARDNAFKARYHA